MNQLNETLRSEAIDLGLCQKWQNDWRGNKNPGQLIEMFKRGIDFCLERRWPSCDWIRANFDVVELHHHNLCIKEKDAQLTVSEGVVVVRESTAKIMVERNAVVTIHCQDCPGVEVVLGKGARAFIHLYNTKCQCNSSSMYSVAKAYIHDQKSEYDENK